MTIEDMVSKWHYAEVAAFKKSPWNYKVISSTTLEEPFSILVCLQVGKDRPNFQYIYKITFDRNKGFEVEKLEQDSGRAEDVRLWSCR